MARSELRRFVQSGGTLLVDAAGGDTAFADAAEASCPTSSSRSPPTPPSSLAGRRPDHPVYTLPARSSPNRLPRLRAQSIRQHARPASAIIEIKNRPAVFFSKEDLSVGLVGQSVDGIYGYDPKTATQLAANVILFATGEAKKASTKPTTKPTTGPTTPWTT